MFIVPRGRIKIEMIETFRGVEYESYSVEFDNIITSAGTDKIASLLMESGATKLDSTNAYIALGTGGGSPSIADTALFNEPGSGTFRKQAASVNRSGSVITYTATFATTEANGSITEVGLFDASSSGNLFNHALLPSALNKGSSATLTVSIILTIQAG